MLTSRVMYVWFSWEKYIVFDQVYPYHNIISTYYSWLQIHKQTYVQYLGWVYVFLLKGNTYVWAN